jgi:hypothetical protein
MKAVALVVLMFIGYCFAQDAIPIPSSHPTAVVITTVNIGDFDGDGADDLYVKYSEYGSSSSSYSLLAVYSMNKNQLSLLGVTLLDMTHGPFPDQPDAIGDFNGDGSKDIVVQGMIYTKSSTTVSKKKA